jgi:hypothetical protein
LTPSADLEHQDRLVITVPRSAVMLTHSALRLHFMLTRIVSNGSYFISAIYDQGGTHSSSSNITQRAYQPIERLVPFSKVVGLFVGIATILGSVVIWFWKTMKPG